MRTTIQLDHHLHELARRHATAKGITFTNLVEEALREKLLPKKKGILKTVGGDGLLVGYELANNSALLSSMEQE